MRFTVIILMKMFVVHLAEDKPEKQEIKIIGTVKNDLYCGHD
uniref:Uncharacterized protein n=1 Tax=Rhizophora mucronata TaxID=61149 RepID=A0A2P2N2L4_RHIMU